VQEARIAVLSPRTCRWCKSALIFFSCAMCDRPVCRKHSLSIGSRSMCKLDCRRESPSAPKKYARKLHSRINLNEVRRALGTGDFVLAGKLLGPYKAARGDSIKGRPYSRQPL